jgi:hypothetical protein
MGQHRTDVRRRVRPEHLGRAQHRRAGRNFGWPQVEGIGGDDRYIDPVQQWSPAEASPSGITIVDDTIFIANRRGQMLRAVPTADPATAVEHYPGEFGRIRGDALPEG